MKTENLKRIAALIAVADNQSLTLASHRLGCSKAYLSQQIKKLEAHYQVQLFHRTTRQLKLTDAGATFVNDCRQALRLVEQAETNLQAVQASISGIIQITCVGGIFGEQHIAPAILSFMKEHPNIQVHLDLSSTHQDLIASHFDIAIRMGPLDDSSLVARTLCLYRPTMVASPAYLARFGEPLHPRDLNQHKLITGSITNWTFKRGNESYDHKVSTSLSCANGHVMMAACEAGLGIGRLPSLYVESAIEKGQLMPVLSDWHQQQNPCSIVYPPGRYRLERVKLLVEWLLAHYQANPL
ncbi:MAG TPA: LysR family transcriptional regulator [Marinagarivorans sp.]